MKESLALSAILMTSVLLGIGSATAHVSDSFQGREFAQASKEPVSTPPIPEPW